MLPPSILPSRDSGFWPVFVLVSIICGTILTVAHIPPPKPLVDQCLEQGLDRAACERIAEDLMRQGVGVHR